MIPQLHPRSFGCIMIHTNGVNQRILRQFLSIPSPIDIPPPNAEETNGLEFRLDRLFDNQQRTHLPQNPSPQQLEQFLQQALAEEQTQNSCYEQSKGFFQDLATAIAYADEQILPVREGNLFYNRLFLFAKTKKGKDNHFTSPGGMNYALHPHINYDGNDRIQSLSLELPPIHPFEHLATIPGHRITTNRHPVTTITYRNGQQIATETTHYYELHDQDSQLVAHIMPRTPLEITGNIERSEYFISRILAMIDQMYAS